ncbi:hypothetical protein GP486_003548 [Trichoglossum hirsutum]|uniref:Uncharacterized protein n=1 Tax=Trichoglossum hirsutum TaxID=265104 RepID=A0A9P8RQI8_9PEZI|nr:hypothetical protein GP486_003548 [Trichoglossum hirsutum]
MPKQSLQPAIEEEVAEALHHFRKIQYKEHKEVTCQLAAYNATIVKKETLYQKTDNKDKEASELTEILAAWKVYVKCFFIENIKLQKKEKCRV